MTLARGTRPVRDRRVVSVRIRFSRAGLRVLSGPTSTRRSYRLTASFMGFGGMRFTRTASVALPRQPRR